MCLFQRVLLLRFIGAHPIVLLFLVVLNRYIESINTESEIITTSISVLKAESIYIIFKQRCTNVNTECEQAESIFTLSTYLNRAVQM